MNNPRYSNWKGYGYALGATVVATAARVYLDPFLGDNLPYITFILALGLVSFYGGPRPSLLALVVSAVAANWLFIPPRHSFALSALGSQVSFVSFLAVGIGFVWASHAWRRAKEREESDCSRRRRAEEALRGSEDRFRLACAAARVGVFEFDVDADRWFWENDRMYEIFGRAREDGPLSKTEFVGTYLHPDDVPIWEEAFRDGLFPGGAFRPLIRFRRPDGVVRWIQCAGVFEKTKEGGSLRLLGMVVDVTEQQSAKEEIALLNRKLEERVAELQALFALAPVGIFVAQDPECRTVKANPAGVLLIEAEPYSRFSMRTPDKSRPPFQMLRHGNILPTELPMQYATAHGVELKNQEIEVEYPDGRRQVLDASAAPLRDETGAVRGSVGVFVDITSRKQAEEHLRQLATSLEQRVDERTRELMDSQVQLRALAAELNLAEQRERKRLATDLHDYLAQMLVLARLKIGQAKGVPGLMPRSAELLAGAEDALRESLAYTRTLVADLSPPVLQEFGLPAALKWLTERMKRHDLRVTVDVEDQVCGLPEDHAVLLFQSVRELLMNVVKHANVQEACVRLRCQPDRLVLEVRDAGRGFESAERVTRTAQSESFGLFSIRERMRALGGCLEVESTPREGTTARLTLPLSGEVVLDRTSDASGMEHSCQAPSQPSAFSSEGSRPNAVPDRPDASRIVRVLLVDDHAMVRQGLRSILESYPDIEVVGEASDGESAVALVEQLRPSIVVMDINMPKMNGMEATARITRRHPGISVIGLSVNAEEDNHAAMRAAGAAMLLTKEAAVEQLYAAIQKTVQN